MRRHLSWMARAFGLAGFVCFGSNLAHATNEPVPVKELDVQRYLGRWYEIARLPMRFQSEDCMAPMATYALRPDGQISVRNECRQGSLTGQIKSISGKAWIPNAKDPGKLKVQFFWPFSGDYWVLALGPAPDYGYALVGGPSRKSLWVLSRTPSLPAEHLAQALAIAQAQGYDIKNLFYDTHSK